MAVMPPASKAPCVNENAIPVLKVSDALEYNASNDLNFDP
jgi:hypothetical protein